MKKDTEVVIEVGTGNPAKKIKFEEKGKYKKVIEVSFSDPLFPGVESFALLSDKDKESLQNLLKVPKA